MLNSHQTEFPKLLKYHSAVIFVGQVSSNRVYPITYFTIDIIPTFFLGGSNS